jgi:hypothetical protein
VGVFVAVGEASSVLVGVVVDVGTGVLVAELVDVGALVGR